MLVLLEWIQTIVGENNHVIAVPLAMWLVQLTTYAIAGSLFTFLDLVHTPETVYAWKVQTAQFGVEKTERHPSLWTTLARVLVAFAVILPSLIGIQYVALKVGLGIRCDAPLPPWYRFALDAVLIGLLSEFGFYTAHRLFHMVPWLYKNIHKEHHEFKTTVAIAATAAHPVEVVLGNTVPIQLWPFLLGSHPYLVLIGSVIGTLSTMYDHCGYWLFGNSKLTVQPFFHDWHHEKNTGNFGFLGIADRLFGTDLTWRKEFRTRKVELLKRAAGMKVH